MTVKANSTLKEQIKDKARRLGFDLVGVCKPDYSPGDHNHLLNWLGNGYHADMEYMSRNPRLRSDPRLLLEDVKSVISVGINYYKEPGYSPDKPYISIYARGKPYQPVLKNKLKALFEFIRQYQPGIKGKIAVDTTPTFDKMWAERAGLGWRGKHTIIINKNIGSFIFIGELFLNIELEPDIPGKNLCADCRKCVDACPSGALEQAYLLNARKCISYLTIETKSDLHNPELIKNHIFGCDLCQLVCPYNQSAKVTQTPEFLTNRNFDAEFKNNWANFDEDEYKNRYEGTILHEYGFNKYEKNARIVNNNLKDIEC